MIKRQYLMLLILILLTSMTMHYKLDVTDPNNREFVWNMDPEFNYGDEYWYRRVGEWGLLGNYRGMNFTDLDIADFEERNGDVIAHLCVNHDPDFIDGYTTMIVTITQGWIWNSTPKVFQPSPLHINETNELIVETKLLFASCSGIEAAVLINAWFLIYDVFISGSFNIVYYKKIILGLDIYLEHLNTPLMDYQLREAVSFNGTPVYVFTRYIDNGTGIYRINLLKELKNAVRVASKSGIIINLEKASLIQIEAVVDEFYGYSEAAFSYLKVLYSKYGTKNCDSLNLNHLIIKLFILLTDHSFEIFSIKFRYFNNLLILSD